MLLNKAKFAENGNCGYVLKPSFLRSDSIGNIFQSYRDTFKKIKKEIDITVISGQQLKIPTEEGGKIWDIADPYVYLKVRGAV